MKRISSLPLLSALTVLAAAVPALATAYSPVACTMEAKLCPDGVTYVGRQGPNCEFAACPSKACSPYMCADGTQVARCAADGSVINYFAAPCHTHGGEVGAASFADVSASHPNATAIAYLKAQNLVSGYPDGTFKPDQPINRAEFTKIIMNGYNGLDEVPQQCGSNNMYLPFSDVHQADWFAFRVCLAVEASIVQGYPDGTFRPAANINFVEAAKIIANSFDLPSAQTNVWYEGYVRALADDNAIPTSINSFDQAITRGEMAEMIYRLSVGITTKSSRTYDELAGEESDNWLRFNSQYFTLSFDVPVGFEVTDNPDAIAISKGPLQEYAIGGGSAFMTIVRFDERNTRDDEIALTRRLLKNQKESTITVDGSPFFMIEGDDYGRYEGSSAGRIMKIFFPKSVLEVQERPGNQTQDFDVMVTANRIISTMNFSSAAK